MDARHGLAVVAIGLACARAGDEPAQQHEVAPEPYAPPSVAEVCRHLVELRAARGGDTPDDAALKKALLSCDDGYGEARRGLSGVTLERAETRAACLLAAKDQPALAECSIVELFWMDVDGSASTRFTQMRDHLGRLIMAAERYAMAIEPREGLRPRCPLPQPGEAIAGPVPPLAVRCEPPASGGCKAVATPRAPDEYAASMWKNDPVWSALGFAIDGPHRFHYALKMGVQKDGSCQFTAQAFGDLDDDRVFSTYELSVAVDDMGPNEAAGLYIDRSDE